MAYRLKYSPYKHGIVDLLGACQLLGEGEDHPMSPEKVIALAQAGTIPVQKDCYASIQAGDFFHTQYGYVKGGICWYFPRKELEEYRGIAENREEQHGERMLRLNLEEIGSIMDFLLELEEQRKRDHHRVIVELGNVQVKLQSLEELGALKVLTEDGLRQLGAIKEALDKASLDPQNTTTPKA